MAIGKWVKKKSAQATKSAGKRYNMSYGRRGLRMGKNSLSKIAKDVMMLKASLNTEKKFVDIYELDNSVGQVRGNGDGALNFEATPPIAQGVEEANRVGNSIKATGLVLKFSMLKQALAEGTRRVRIYVVRSTDPSLSSNDIHFKMLDTNPFVPVRDYNSNLDYTEFKDGALRVIAKKDIYFGQNGGDSQINPQDQMSKSITLPVKLNDVLRYGTNASTFPENVKYHVIMVADNGNADVSTPSSILGAYVTAANSGIRVKCHSRMWYVDN